MPTLPQHPFSSLALLARMGFFTFLSIFGLAVAVADEGTGEESFKVIGYQPSWSGNVADIQYEKLTHINYSFIFPKPDGTFKDTPRPEMLNKLVELAHAKDVKVGIAIGGWNDGDDSAFEKLAASPKSRKMFVSETMKLVKTYDLDGVDMDWEYPDAGDSSENFLLLMRDLSTELRSADKFLSTAVVSLGNTGKGIKEEIFPLIDMLNIMAYDGREHGLFSQAEESIRYWSERGCPKTKLVLGLPFYGRSPYRSYRDLVKEDPTAPTKDTIGEVRYNGIATMKKKTRLGLEMCGGVMIWELSQDVRGENSLLGAVSEVIAEKPKILLIGKDPDHPWGTHMYLPTCVMLTKCLRQLEGVETVVSAGWPKDQKELVGVKAIVFYTDPAAEMMLDGPNADAFKALMDQGVGLVTIHWASSVYQKNLDRIGDQWMGYLGGTWISNVGLSTDKSNLKQLISDHPICRGWSEYELHDEFYLNPTIAKGTPLLQVTTKGKDVIVGWMNERKDGGRAFATTLGHFYSNFQIDAFRQMIANGILWTAHVDVPNDGAPIKLTEDQLALPEEPKKE